MRERKQRVYAGGEVRTYTPRGLKRVQRAPEKTKRRK